MIFPTNVFAAALAAAASALAAAPAFAHHAMGGETPGTAFEGFVSGLAHPVIGIDHLAFVVAIGIIAAFTRIRRAGPAIFVAATLGGCLAAVGGLALSFGELAVALSVVLAGCLALSGRSLPVGALGVLFALAGFFHGLAYGGAIVGAEQTPLLAYLLGFGLIQFAMASIAGLVARTTAGAEGARAVGPRLAGALAAGIGVAILFEQVEGLIFA